jgi:hypothetical protein
VIERERLDLWSAQNPRDHLARAAIAAWNGCPPEAMPASWVGHTCPATKAAWARVSEAVAVEIAAALAARWREAMADWDQGGEAALVEMDGCIAGRLPDLAGRL